MVKQDRRPREQAVSVPYERSRTYVAAAADSASVTMRADEAGAQVQINFTRVDASPTVERYRAVQDDNGGVRQVTPPTFDQPDRKIVECSVLMRPDHAIQLAAVLLQTLGKLPKPLRTLYHIPEIGIDEVSK